MWRASNGMMSPRDVDDLYIWEIAVLLGVSDELKTAEETSGKSSGGSSPAKRARLRQRVQHARGEAPKPEAAPLDPNAFKALAAKP